MRHHYARRAAEMYGHIDRAVLGIDNTAPEAGAARLGRVFTIAMFVGIWAGGLERPSAIDRFETTCTSHETAGLCHVAIIDVGRIAAAARLHRPSGEDAIPVIAIRRIECAELPRLAQIIAGIDRAFAECRIEIALRYRIEIAIGNSRPRILGQHAPHPCFAIIG